MIIQQINQSQFIDLFKALRPDNFSYKGLIALYDYFEEYTDDTQVDYELDVIALCCEYSEYKDLADVQTAYPKIKSISELEDHTQVITFDGGIIIENF